MRNIYAYTTENDLRIRPDYVEIKIGDSHHSTHSRTKQQQTGQSSRQIIINPFGDLEDRSWGWTGLTKIKGDGDVHNHKALAKYRKPANQSGDEWFSIPVDPSLSDEEKIRYIWGYLDDVISDLEGRKARPKAKYRKTQVRRLDQAMTAIAKGKTEGIANLCPRFGKTLWALGLFDRITEKYGNRVMLVPVYWLGVHTSFDDECAAYDDFQDIVVINLRHEENAEAIACAALQAGKRILLLISLHGKMKDDEDEEAVSTWVKRHRWIQMIPNTEKFMFADEGDWGTHTPNQVKKLQFLFAGK